MLKTHELYPIYRDIENAIEIVGRQASDIESKYDITTDGCFAIQFERLTIAKSLLRLVRNAVLEIAEQ